MGDCQSMGRPLCIAAFVLGATGLNMGRGLRTSFNTVAWMKYAAKHGIQFEHDRQLVAVTRAGIRRAPREEKAA